MIVTGINSVVVFPFLVVYVDRHVDLAAYPGEAGTVAQALHRQVADGTFRGSRAAAFEGDGRHGCGRGGHGFRFVVVIAAASAAGVGYLRVAGDGDFLVIQLLLLQAAVVDPLDLYADLFLQAVQRIARDGAGAGTGIGVLVRIELSHPPPFISPLFLNTFPSTHPPVFEKKVAKRLPKPT